MYICIRKFNRSVFYDEKDEEYKYFKKDVVDYLGIKCKYSIDKRIVCYLFIAVIFLILSILTISKTYKLNQQTEGTTIKIIILWVVSIIVSMIAAVLIYYFISNPRLVFGSFKTNRMIEALTGYRLLNPQ